MTLRPASTSNHKACTCPSVGKFSVHSSVIKSAWRGLRLRDFERATCKSGFYLPQVATLYSPARLSARHSALPVEDEDLQQVPPFQQCQKSALAAGRRRTARQSEAHRTTVPTSPLPTDTASGCHPSDTARRAPGDQSVPTACTIGFRQADSVVVHRGRSGTVFRRGCLCS